MICYEEHKIKEMAVVVNAIKLLNNTLESISLATLIERLSRLIDEGREDEK